MKVYINSYKIHVFSFFCSIDVSTPKKHRNIEYNNNQGFLKKKIYKTE